MLLPSSDPDVMGVSLAALTEYFVGDATMGETLTRTAELTTEAVPQATFVGITMIVDDKLGTYVFTHPEIPEIDRAQYDTGEGPCVEAYRTGRPALLESTLQPDRWIEFAKVAAEHGIRSTLSLPLLTAMGTIGAMNLYAEVEAAFTPTDVASAQRFAAQACVLLANAQAYWDARELSEGLRTAMEKRATIEQAKGLIMAATGCSPDEAFTKLSQQSQYENVKLRELAARLVANAQGKQHE